MTFINFVLPMHSLKEVASIKFLHLFPQSLTMLLNRTPHTSVGICLCSFYDMFHTEGLHWFPANVTVISVQRSEWTDGRSINGEAERILLETQRSWGIICGVNLFSKIKNDD